MSLARIGVVASKMTLYTAEATDDVRGASLEQGSVRLGLRRSSAFVLSAIRAQGVLEGSRVLRLVPYRDLRGKRQQPKRQVQTLTPVCLGKFALYGEGLNIGRDGGAPVTLDYPGERPWDFTGGTIHRVICDVSGEPYLDLEKEAIAMMKRD